jgi:hypothetical protein
MQPRSKNLAVGLAQSFDPMSDNLWKQPFYRWPDRPFWRVMAPVLVLVWFAAMFCYFRGAERLSLIDIGDALFVLFLNFALCALGRLAFRRKNGL